MSHTGLSGMFGQSMSNNLGQSISGAVGAQNPYMNQGMAAQNNAAYQAQQQVYKARPDPEWVIAGKAMSITEFADELFGDTPARTMFLLKYSDKGK
jgi:hypothetical protein